MVFPEAKLDMSDLIMLNYKEMGDLHLPQDTRMFHIPGSTFFPILFHSKDTTELVICAESIRDFQRVWSIKSEIEGVEDAPYNILEAVRQEDRILKACERRGYNGFLVKETTDLEAYHNSLEYFKTRKRETKDDLNSLAEEIKTMSADLDTGRMADAFFRAEREYWIEKNSAARHQKELQDDVGLGWANRDHQAFRCSRESFSQIVGIFESMGMQSRERFYAGEQAGWGAQVLEHPICKEAVFADVYLYPEESEGDFAHERLSPKKEPGTVGLWVGDVVLEPEGWRAPKASSSCRADRGRNPFIASLFPKASSKSTARVPSVSIGRTGRRAPAALSIRAFCYRPASSRER